MKTKFLLAAALGALLVSTGANARMIKIPYSAKGLSGPTLQGAWDLSAGTDTGKAATFTSSTPTPTNPVTIMWEGISQYDNAIVARPNYIPPDTMGAVGLTQYFETANGVYSIYDKATGAQQMLSSDTAWWGSVGQPAAANGDSRVMYNADAKRWIVISFAGSVANLQVAVSDTDDAMGGWKSTVFSGFAGGTADYPTLALDKTSVYIGTNNFKVGCNPFNTAANGFCGTTLNVIPLDSLFNNSTPTVANMKQFVNTYTYGFGADVDQGFAQQGVNSSSEGTPGYVVANSLFYNDNVAFDVNGLTSSSATGGSLSTLDAPAIGMATMTDAGPARQPSPIVANQRIIDTLGQRISSSAYEVGGLIYMVQTVDSAADGLDEARVRYTIIDATTKAIVAEGDIGTAGYDYYQGAIAVNALGQVVVVYNRSGSQTGDANNDGYADGNISVMAQTFKTSASGDLVAVSGELLLKVSPTSDYHNGSLDGQAANGRQRWGDYAQVSLDPGTTHGFYVIGEFAREPNNPANGHPTGTGGTRWGTWIAGLNVGSVPEPASWAMMITGFGFIGGAMRRQRKSVATA